MEAMPFCASEKDICKLCSGKAEKELSKTKQAFLGIEAEIGKRGRQLGYVDGWEKK